MNSVMGGYLDTVAAHHRRELSLHGLTVRALGWSFRSQQKRFEALAQVGTMTNARVLDVGCGLGDFLSFLHERGTTPASYTGVDLLPEFIHEARIRHPEGEFHSGDLFSLGNTRRWDFCIASGIFYMPSHNWANHVHTTVIRMLELCDEAIAVNFLSSRSRRPDGVSEYAEPESVFSLLGGSPEARIVLRHDYLPNDFTVYLYRKGYE